MSTKHTPGPWALETNGAAFNVISPDRGGHFCMLIGMVSQPDGEHAANAALIARAPKMAEEIRGLEEENATLKSQLVEMLQETPWDELKTAAEDAIYEIECGENVTRRMGVADRVRAAIEGVKS